MYKIKLYNTEELTDEPYQISLYFSNEKDAKIVQDFIDTQNSDHYEFDDDQEELEYLLERYGKYKNYTTRTYNGIEVIEIEPPIPRSVQCHKCGFKTYNKYCGECGNKMVNR